jgi:hypothetical protein
LGADGGEVNVINWVTIRRFSELSGYTEDAVRSKIADGTWLSGWVWRKAPDGRILVSIRGYEEWAEGQASAPQVARASGAVNAVVGSSRGVSLLKQELALDDQVATRRAETAGEMMTKAEVLAVALQALEIYQARNPAPSAVTLADAAQMLGCSRRTVHRMRLPRTAGGMVPYSAVLECLAAR